MARKIRGSSLRSHIKVSLIIILFFLAVITCLHIWFVKNANRILIDLVDQKSEGKLKLELSAARFDIFSNEVSINRAKILSTSKNRNPITYNVGFRKVILHTNSVWSLLFNMSPEIRELNLYDPTIEVFNWQHDTEPNAIKNLSLGMELGKIYKTVQDAITILNTHSISITNATLILKDEGQRGSKPVIFSNIYFSLKKLDKQKNPNGSFLQNHDITFSSSNQDIMLTDGIHKLLFKRLAVEHATNIILDSCTITALSTRTSDNSFNIHFKKLALKGVDFDALYKTNLIRADSVYCENPTSEIILNSTSNVDNNRAQEIPDFEKIIQEFTGNLDLGFVGVTNADIHFNITGKKSHTNIHSGKVNFQVKNLRVNPDSSKLITINSFDMLIKGYQLYNADSSVIYSFDSVRFANDQLLLNNFSVHTTTGINKIRNYRDYSMSYFELLGLDWSELIFQQNLKATDAILHEPTINFKRTANVDISKRAIVFNPAHTFDDFMEIDRLRIVNGQININWSDNNSLQLQDINLSLLADNIKDYKHVRLQKDVQFLFVRNGYLRLGDITARLQNVNFNPDDNIHVDEVTIHNNRGEIDSRMSDVSIKNIYSTSAGNYVIDGLEWSAGNILISALPTPKSSIRRASIKLKNISGKNTQFRFVNDKNEATAFVEQVQIASLEKNNGVPISLRGISIEGREMKLSAASQKFNSTIFFLSDRIQKFSGVAFQNAVNGSMLNISMPFMEISASINSFFSDNHHVENIMMKAPVIEFKKQEIASAILLTNGNIPAIKVDNTTMQDAAINVRLEQGNGSKSFYLPAAKGSELKIKSLEFSCEGIQINALDLKTKKAEVFNDAGKVFSVDDGVDLNLSKIYMRPNEDNALWGAMITKLSMKNTGGFTFKLKESELELKDIALGDCVLSSTSVASIDKLLTSNQGSWFSTSYAKYNTKKSVLQSFNLNYNVDKNMLSMDSINYQPHLSRDSAIAVNPYQIDYITFNSGTTKLYGFDIVKYLIDDSLLVKKLSLKRPSIAVYRDKFPPFLEGIRKKLFVEQIKNIPLALYINQISVDDGNVSYTEQNAKTRREGTLLLTHLNGYIFNVSNCALTHPDSLSMNFNGQLLDTAFFNLSIDQSFTDPLCGFVMVLSIEPTALSILNPLLTPLSYVKFTSGKIDKFEMKATGNENYAKGEMDFYYRDLRIQLLKNDESARSTFIKRVESALVNIFILKTENRQNRGLIYFRRLKDRSFFNYMSKIIASGVITSTGVKKNKRYIKNMRNDEATF